MNLTGQARMVCAVVVTVVVLGFIMSRRSYGNNIDSASLRASSWCESSPRLEPSFLAQASAASLELAVDRLRNDSSLQIGGFFSPERCGRTKAKCRTAILVPYRHRERNLNAFLAYMHPFLQRQGIEYRIYIISQADDGQLFNRGALLNIGFVVASSDWPWDCYILHDVDLLPESPSVAYECWDQPRHMNVAPRISNYQLPYANYFGGVSAVKPQHMIGANGFSNSFFGWGGEDDDFATRLKRAGFQILRDDPRVARYYNLEHEPQPANDLRYYVLDVEKHNPRKSGLNTVAYKLLGINSDKLFINITPTSNVLDLAGGLAEVGLGFCATNPSQCRSSSALKFTRGAFDIEQPE